MKGSAGIVREIAKKLGCQRQTVVERLKNSKKLKKALKNETESSVDISEIALLMLVRDLNFNAIKYHLDAKGKSRGYGIQNIKQEIKQDIKQESIKKIEIEIV